MSVNDKDWIADPEKVEQHLDQLLDEMRETVDPHGRTKLLLQYDHAEMNTMFVYLADRHEEDQRRLKIATAAGELIAAATSGGDVDSNRIDEAEAVVDTDAVREFVYPGTVRS